MPPLSPGMFLAVAAAMAMALLMGTFLWVIAGHREMGRRRQRVGALVKRYRPAEKKTQRPSMLIEERPELFGNGLLASITGVDRARTHVYPMPWQGAFAIGIGIGGLLGLWLVLGVGMSVMIGILVALGLGIVAPRMILAGFIRRYEHRLLIQLPDALGMIVRGVRSGIPLAASIGSVAEQGPQPTAAEFEKLGHDLHMGVDFDRALFNMAARCGLAEYAFFAVAVGLQSQTGGSLTGTLENLAEVIRKRVALQMRAVALASEARTSAGILVAVPFVAAGAVTLLNPEYIGTLFTDSRGHYVLGSAIFMMGCGIMTMRMLLQRMLR